MIATASITIPYVGTALAGSTWTDVAHLCAVLLSVAVLMTFALYAPLRARLLASISALLCIGLGVSIYTESEKRPGQWFSRTTCVATLDRRGNVLRTFYRRHSRLRTF